MPRFLFFIIGFFLLDFPLFSQFTLYNLANTGEPVDKVTSLGVVGSGYVYAGTYDAGLVQYDGVSNWQTFDGSISGFPNNYITSIYINSSDVWVTTSFGGIGKYSGGLWSTISMSSSSNNLPDDEVWGVRLDASGNLDIATYSGFAIDSIPNGNWNVFTTTNTPSLETQSFYCLSADLSGKLYLGTRGKGLAKFDAGTWQFFKTQNSAIINDTVNVIKRASNGMLWVGTDAGLSAFDGSNWTNYTYSSTSGGLPGDQVNSIAFDNSGNIFVGTNNGLGIFNTNTSAWITHTTSNSNLPENSITAVATDLNSNELWVGTASSGLAVGSIGQLTPVDKGMELISQHVIVYPNPASDKINIQFSCEKEIQVKISLNDFSGKELLNFEAMDYNTGQHIVSTNCSGLKQGVYLLKVSTPNTIITKSILID